MQRGTVGLFSKAGSTGSSLSDLFRAGMPVECMLQDEPQIRLHNRHQPMNRS